MTGVKAKEKARYAKRKAKMSSAVQSSVSSLMVRMAFNFGMRYKLLGQRVWLVAAARHTKRTHFERSLEQLPC